MPRGDRKAISNFPIPLPPLPLQQLFAHRIEQIENQKAEVQKAIITRVRDNILKSKEQKTIQPTKGGHKMVTYQNYVSLFYCQITSCPSDGGIS